MDFTKYISLLATKSLFFSRADKLGDPFEGAKMELKNKPKWNKFYLNFFIEAIKTAPGDSAKLKSDAEIKREAQKLLKSMSGIGDRQLKETYINCWYEGIYESDAMWKIYGSSLDQSVAIRTTYKRLYKALGKNPSIHIGRVKYIDFSKQFAGINDSFWYKRKSFEHEREVRAMLIDHTSKKENGMLIPVNVDVLIEKVYLSPASKEWFEKLVQEVMPKFDIDKRIMRSQMAVIPVFS